MILNSKNQKKVVDVTRALEDTADTSITTLMLKVLNKGSDRKSEFAYTPSVNASSPYDGGVLTGYARVPLEGDVLNHSLLPVNGLEHIENFQKGNYGARINLSFPEGVDAQSMFKAIDWDVSQTSTKSLFYIRALGIPTPVKLTFGLKWDRTSVKFSTLSNEFSIVLRGINKSEVSTTEWDKYSPLITESALALVGAIPGGGVLGNMQGWAEGSLSFDMSKYGGNTDDITQNKELTKGRLFPNKTREDSFTLAVLDRESLIAGTEGKGNISKALVKTGHEHDNPQTSNVIDTWDSYLSIWDRERKYNTGTSDNDEVTGESGVLPGPSIFNRSISLVEGDDFNKFEKNRFNRVVNYYTKKDVTEGKNGDIDSVEVSHSPENIDPNRTTAVTYSGSVQYYDGQVRQLIPNVLNVTSGNTDHANTVFKAGYWSDDQSFLAIEGEFNNSEFDFSKKGNTNYTLMLNQRGKTLYKTAATTTDFYNPETFDGYQALIETSVLGDSNILPKGSYSITIQAVNSKGTIEKPMLASEAGLQYIVHYAWDEIETKSIYGRNVTFTISPQGEALLNID